MLVIMSIGVNGVMGLAKDSRRAQDSDQLAKELNLIGKATKTFLLAADPATYPLNTSVAIPVSTLVSGGFLPTDFAARMGPGTAATSPFGQPYMVVARRIVAGEPPTAVVSEGSLPTPVKLAKIGVEDTDAAILALKQSVSAQGGRDCKTIAATIAKAGRTAIGVGNSFTKDLTAYFAAGFAQASAVALVNFKDLEPGGGGEGGNPVADAPKYSNCGVVQGQILGAGITSFMNVCSSTSGPGGMESGKRIVGDRDISVCGNNGQITVLPASNGASTPHAAVHRGSRGPRHDLAGDLLGSSDFRCTKVERRLQVQPALRITAEVTRQAQGRVRTHGTALTHDIVDARRRHTQGGGQRVRAHAQRKQEFFPQKLAGVHRGHAVFTAHGYLRQW